MRRVLAIVAILTTIFGTGAASVLAQSGTMVVSIPFDFTVGSVTLGAGRYTAHMIGSSVLTVESMNGAHSANVLTNAAQAKDLHLTQGKLVFTRYGDQYFLCQAFWPGYGQGREAVKSKREIEIARNLNTVKEVNITGNATAAIPK